MNAAALDPFSLSLIAGVFAAVVALAAHAKAEGERKNFEQIAAWLLPAFFALAISIVTAWLYNQIDFGSPDALLQVGAHYAARSNGHEPWRFASSFFAHDELLLALVNSLALLWIGWHLARQVGTLGFIGALFTCHFTACLAATEADLQTLFYGAGAGLFGISVLTLTVQKWKQLKSRDVAALAAIFFHTGVTLLVAGEAGVVGIESVAAAGVAGLSLGAFTYLFRKVSARTSVPKKRWIEAFLTAGFVTCIAATMSGLWAPEDVITALRSARNKKEQLTERLAELEANRSAGMMSAGEFSQALTNEILLPTEKATDEIETLLRARASHARWLEHERSDGAVKVLSLEIIATVYAAKERLLTARDQITAGEDSPELETFWRQTAPLLQRQIKALYELSAKPSAQKMLVKARTAAASDLVELEAAATDLEIMRGERYLSELRSMVFGQSTKDSDEERKPASDEDWAKISQEIEQHRSRLELTASRITRPSSRVTSLLEHLKRAASAVELDPKN